MPSHIGGTSVTPDEREGGWAGMSMFLAKIEQTGGWLPWYAACTVATHKITWRDLSADTSSGAHVWENVAGLLFACERPHRHEVYR